MRSLLRALFCAGLLAGALIPAASGQWGPEVVGYSDLVQDGDTVFAYAYADIQLPPCPAWGTSCWEEYWSYVAVDLYWDGNWLLGYWSEEFCGYSSAWAYDDAWEGYWQAWADHEVSDVWWRDEYWWPFFEPSRYVPSSPPPLTINPDISISGSQVVDDGGTGYFDVTARYATPASYEWSFENSSPAGNDPGVQFSDPYGASTLTDARWYAHPDSVCSADPAATYTITAEVGFNSGTLSDWTWFWVNGWWDPAGWTGAPSLPINLYPYFSGGRWRVHTDTQVEKVYSFTMIWVSGSSQFWYKTWAHEQEHRRQWEPGGLMGELYSPVELRARLLGLSAETQADLVQLVQQTADGYMEEQSTLSEGLEEQSEREAYAESDHYAPWYIYEGQCKGY